MAVDRIPVFPSFSVDQAEPVGFGAIEGDELVIRIKHGQLVSSLEHMVEAEQIKELYLGVGYPVNSTTIVRERPVI
jgi:hypothetical protein